MSKLYATIDSDARKTRATARGHRRIITHAASWNGAIQVVLTIGEDGKERYEVRRIAWHGRGADKAHMIAEGEM